MSRGCRSFRSRDDTIKLRPHRLKLERGWGPTRPSRRPLQRPATGTAVWYHGGLPPVPIRWMIVGEPTGAFKPQAFLATDPDVTCDAMLGLFSLVVLWMNDIVKAQRIAPKATAWSRKTHLTFADSIAAVRRDTWDHQTFAMSRADREIVNIQPTSGNASRAPSLTLDELAKVELRPTPHRKRALDLCASAGRAEQ